MIQATHGGTELTDVQQRQTILATPSKIKTSNANALKTLHLRPSSLRLHGLLTVLWKIHRAALDGGWETCTHPQEAYDHHHLLN